MLGILGILHLPIMNHYNLHSPITNVLLDLGVFGSLVSIEEFTWDSSKQNCHFSRGLSCLYFNPLSLWVEHE
jgi:hypothetical protein